MKGRERERQIFSAEKPPFQRLNPKPKPSPVVKKSFWLIKTSIMRNNLTASLATLFHFSLRCCLRSSMCRHFGFDCPCCPADQTDSTQGNCCRAVSLSLSPSHALSLLFSLAWVRNYNALVMPDKKRSNIKRKRTSIFGKHVWRQRGNALISLFLPPLHSPLPDCLICCSATLHYVLDICLCWPMSCVLDSVSTPPGTPISSYHSRPGPAALSLLPFG